MRVIGTIAAVLLRGELRDKASLFWMLIMPVAFIGLFGQMFRYEGGDRTLGLIVVDRDEGVLADRFVDLLAHEDLAVERIGASAAGAAADTGAAATGRRLTIPAGFSDSLAGTGRIALPFAQRGDRWSEADFAVEVHLYQAIARMLAVLAAVDTSGEAILPLDDPAFRSRLEEEIARPDRIRTEVRTAGRGRTVPSGFAGSAQSMLVLFVLMNTSMTGAVLLAQERQGRLLLRLATLPVGFGRLLSGKILGLVGIAAIQAALLVGVGRFVFGVWWGPDPAALWALILALGLASAAIGIFLGGVLRTPEQASAVGWLIPLFLGAIGGCWWPLEIVPHWMRVAGHVSPAAWAMDGLHGLISFGIGGAAVVVPVLVLLGYAVLFTALGARLLRPTE